MEFLTENKRFSFLYNGENTWDYCCNMLKEHISELKLDCLRIDFNFSPLPFWRENDKHNRNGITEIKNINGLYRLWDTLLDEFPGLIIDNCVSGGIRIDIETLKRSVPPWRSDLVCPANYSIKGVQNHNLAYNLWLPYSGSGGGEFAVSGKELAEKGLELIIPEKRKAKIYFYRTR